jgi:elongation factor P
MVSVNDFKTGMTIEYEGNIYTVVEFQHVKPGKGAAFVKAKLKNLRTGSNIEITFNSSVRVNKANIEKKYMQYLYNTGDTYVFMNTETYEQVELNESQIKDEVDYLTENLEVEIMFYENEMLGLNLPEKIEMKVVRTEPGVKGNTTTNATKDAELETGLVVRVPLFVEEGEVLIISTRDGKYVSRK